MEYLYLGINSHVVCIKKSNGKELWRTKIKRSTITNVLFDQGKVFAYSGGHLFSLDAKSGEIEWENELSGLGYGMCIIASENQSTSVMAEQAAAQQAAIAATTTVAATSSNSNAS